MSNIMNYVTNLMNLVFMKDGKDISMPELQKTRKPFMLMKNVVYSTYQLHAHTSNNQTPPEDAFKIVILEVMSWLRERFRALDVPEEI